MGGTKMDGNDEQYKKGQGGNRPPMSSPLIQEVETRHSPESLIARLHSSPGTILLRSGTMEHSDRFSLVAARPFLRFESFGSRCIIRSDAGKRTLFGNPWKLLELSLIHI